MEIQVESAGGVMTSSLQTVMQAAAPLVFQMDASGRGVVTIAGTNEIAMTTTDGVPSRPVLHGEYLTIHATGLGEDVDPSEAYAISKRGAIVRVVAAAKAWGARGARIVSLSPGMIATPMGHQESAAQPFMNEMLNTSPVPRLGTPVDIAETVAWLAGQLQPVVQPYGTRGEALLLAVCVGSGALLYAVVSLAFRSDEIHAMKRLVRR